MNIILAYVNDLIFGDPGWLPHPVVLMGRLISRLEKLTRRIFPKSERGELVAGAVTALAVTALTAFLCFGLVSIFKREFWQLALVLDLIMCWQALAVKGLRKEALNIREKLLACENIRAGQSARAAESGGEEASGKGFGVEYEEALNAAKKAVARVVGRDTGALDEEGIIKATVETVAENFSDGVAAPLLYMALGGGPLALCYKAINTLDSMIGYKNERYLYFGRLGARLDDVAGFVPARLAAGIFILSAALIPGLDAKEAFRIWKRDRFKHASPNSAQTEAACAGALGVRLAGPSYYFGEYYDKPFIGDAGRPVELADIDRALKLLSVGSLISVLLCAAVNVIIYGIHI